MFINPKSKEINLKIVYYGPARGGKTTNLEFVHGNTSPKMRGDLVSLKTREDRTLFFDYMQMELPPIKGLKPKFNLYTVPGQIHYEASRKLVLRGADGIIFVADSHKARLEASVTAYRNMHQHLQEMGINPKAIPIIVQFNKRDLPNAVPVDFFKALLGIDPRTPSFEAVAIRGDGVFKTLKAAISQVIGQANRVRERV
jgi:signal recognition particle receptor subunit beta